MLIWSVVTTPEGVPLSARPSPYTQATTVPGLAACPTLPAARAAAVSAASASCGVSPGSSPSPDRRSPSKAARKAVLEATSGGTGRASRVTFLPVARSTTTVTAGAAAASWRRPSPSSAAAARRLRLPVVLASFTKIRTQSPSWKAEASDTCRRLLRAGTGRVIVARYHLLW